MCTTLVSSLRPVSVLCCIRVPNLHWKRNRTSRSFDFGVRFNVFRRTVIKKRLLREICVSDTIQVSFLSLVSISMSNTETVCTKKLTPFNRVSHVVFDLDGTLVDTISAYRDSLNKVIQKYDKEVTWELMPEVIKAPTALGGIQVVVETLNVSINAEEYLNEYNIHLKNAIANVKLMSGALRLLNHLKSQRIPMGLCTALSKKDFQFETQHLNGIFELGNYFEVIVNAEDDPEVKANKPSPDPYLVTINRFLEKPEPRNVLVFEDSYEGIESAVKAGTQCVMLRDPRMHQNVSSLATLSLTSFDEFEPQLFGLPLFEHPHK